MNFETDWIRSFIDIFKLLTWSDNFFRIIVLCQSSLHEDFQEEKSKLLLLANETK